ncbi:MAG: hypothetical protein PHH37_05285 [Paludibacter sp.]|nr:hypothetical protein [Paludibacter sp.]
MTREEFIEKLREVKIAYSFFKKNKYEVMFVTNDYIVFSRNEGRTYGMIKVDALYKMYCECEKINSEIIKNYMKVADMGAAYGIMVCGGFYDEDSKRVDNMDD